VAQRLDDCPARVHGPSLSGRRGAHKRGQKRSLIEPTTRGS
jgi:hypothetical protein